MQIKNIIVLGVLTVFTNMSCQNMKEVEKVDLQHCRGIIDPGRTTEYYYFYRIDEDDVNVTKMIPDIYAHSTKDKFEFSVRGSSRELILKLDELRKNVKNSAVSLQEEKEVMINFSEKSFIYYAKSDKAERYIDAVINVVLDMYNGDNRIIVKKRN